MKWEGKIDKWGGKQGYYKPVSLPPQERMVNMIKNLTPHPVNVRIDGEEDIVFPPEPVSARVEMVESPSTEVEGIPCITRKVGQVIGLPEPCEGVFYLVSSLVMEFSERIDLLCPDTGKTCVRDEHGNVVAVRRFVRK